MTITSFGREKGYPKTRYSLQNSRIVKTIRDRWRIQVDDPNQSGTEIINELPASLQIGFDFGGGFTIREQEIAESENARLLHFLDLTIDDQVSDEDKEDKDKPPDQRRAEWSWDFETLETLFTRDVKDKDLTGKYNPVATSAGEPFEVTTPYVIPVLTVERSQSSFDPDTILNYVNHVNKSTFWGAAPGLALMAGIRDQKGEVYGGVRYRSVSYTIKFRIPIIEEAIEGWKLLLMDYGNIYFASGKKKKFLDDRGQPTKGKLNGLGGQLEDQEDSAIFRKFNQFKEAEFNDLNINWPL